MVCSNERTNGRYPFDIQHRTVIGYKPESSSDFDELKVAAGSSLCDKTLSSIEVRSNHGFLIVGIRHPDGSIVLNPSSDTSLLAGDVVIVLGHRDDIPQLAERFATKPRVSTYRGAVIES